MFSGEESGEAGGVDDPAGSGGGRTHGRKARATFGGFPSDGLLAAGDESDVADADGADQRGAGGDGAVEDFLVEDGAVHLVAGETDIVARAGFAAVAKGLRGVVGKPEPHALLGEVMLVEVFGEAEDAAEKVGADLDGGFPDAAGKFGRAFEDEEAEAGVAAQEQESGRGTGERTADDDDIPRCSGG